jgi:hypothetical protein
MALAIMPAEEVLVQKESKLAGNSYPGFPR